MDTRNNPVKNQSDDSSRWRRKWRRIIYGSFLLTVLSFCAITLPTGDLLQWSQAVADTLQTLPLFILVIILMLTYVSLITFGFPNVVICCATGMLMAKHRDLSGSISSSSGGGGTSSSSGSSTASTTSSGSFGLAFALSCLISSVGLVGGAVLSYYLAKTVFREYAEATVTKNKYLRALKQGFRENGVFLSALMRTCCPHLFLNYGLAVLDLEDDDEKDKERDNDKQGDKDKERETEDGKNRGEPEERIMIKDKEEEGREAEEVTQGAEVSTNITRPITVGNTYTAGPTTQATNDATSTSTRPIGPSDGGTPDRSRQIGLPIDKFILGCVGHIPWILIYSWLGCSLDSLPDLISGAEGDEEAKQRSLFGVVAFCCTGSVLVLVTSRELRRLLKKEEDMKKEAVKRRVDDGEKEEEANDRGEEDGETGKEAKERGEEAKREKRGAESL